MKDSNNNPDSLIRSGLDAVEVDPSLADKYLQGLNFPVKPPPKNRVYFRLAGCILFFTAMIGIFIAVHKTGAATDYSIQATTSGQELRDTMQHERNKPPSSLSGYLQDTVARRDAPSAKAPLQSHDDRPDAVAVPATLPVDSAAYSAEPLPEIHNTDLEAVRKDTLKNEEPSKAGSPKRKAPYIIW